MWLHIISGFVAVAMGKIGYVHIDLADNNMHSDILISLAMLEHQEQNGYSYYEGRLTQSIFSHFAVYLARG